MILNYDFEDDYFEYEPDSDELDCALTSILNTLNKDGLISLVLYIKDSECDLTEYFQDELKEYFEKYAYESYRDSKEYEKDPLGYFGMKQSDFI